MNPTISKISEEKNEYKFTVQGLNVSLANAIRRTILSDIPTTVILTDSKENPCKISVNTSRLHNEILKHRLSCIPVHIKELDMLPGNYSLEVDVKNETDHIIFVTTENFKIKNKMNGNYLKTEEVKKIFPPSAQNYYIDFARLRPKIGDNIPGEHLKLTAEFGVDTAKQNSMFNVVSKCSYGNTMDALKISDFWGQYEDKLKSEQNTVADIEFEKKNFLLLDAQRHFVPDSFDFVIQSVGVYDNREIVKKACFVLNAKFIALSLAIESDTIPINNSETTMEFCFDIVLENEDYTMGKVLEYLLYEKYYVQEKIFTFCGFKKFHPHNTDSIIRIAYATKSDRATVRQHLDTVAIEAAELFQKVYKMF